MCSIITADEPSPVIPFGLVGQIWTAGQTRTPVVYVNNLTVTAVKRWKLLL